ncbi:hypothetical protein G0Q06_13590 [Puniceicoccales bacterium CK1056]|uniref:Uncharacterized protein n=1 Tax=Oceanipulchritudo coccoides TaxID=2706888 RepID=A0A6B2M5K1_9BACT|nr:hypothetical protein [Oceanipulchritudo coccoides]NDV63492.1 hypothetical protein [Oceanipulchritudo coccoides]
MIWMEILVALAVTAFIFLAGMRALHGFMESLAAGRVQQVRLLEMEGLRDSIQRAWDQRSSHPFQNLPWLEVEGLQIGDFVNLSTLRMRTHSTGGDPVFWELKRDRAHWLLWDTPSGVEGDYQQRQLRYQGEIHVEVKKGSWLPGEVPERMTWLFPDAVDSHMKEGFAILQVW